MNLQPSIEPQSNTSQGDLDVVESPTETVGQGATEGVATSIDQDSLRSGTPVDSPVSEHAKDDSDLAFSESESWMTQYSELVKDPRDNNPGTPWRDLTDRLKKLDEDHIRSQMGKIDTLNVIAALMLTIILSYIIQAFQPSQPDPINQIAALLYQISRQLDSLKISSEFINSTVGSLDPDHIPSLDLQGPEHNNFLDEASSCSVFIFIVVPLVGLMAQTWCNEYLKQAFINDRYCRVIHFGFFHSRHISTVAKILHGFLRISLVTVVILFWITLQTEANTVNINSGPVIIVAVIMLPTLILSRLLTPRDAIIPGPVTLDDSQFNDEQVLWEIHKWFDPFGPSIPVETVVELIRKRLHSRMDPLDLHKTGVQFTETSAIRRSLAVSIRMSFFRISLTKNPCFEAKESRHLLAAFKLLCAPRNFERWGIHIREEIVLFLQAYLVTPQPAEALARYLAWISCIKDWRAVIPLHITGKQLLAIIESSQYLVDHEPKAHLAANRSVLYQLVILCAIRTSHSVHGTPFENEFRHFIGTLSSSLKTSQDPPSVSDLVPVRNWHVTLHLAMILGRRMPGIIETKFIEELDRHCWNSFRLGVRSAKLDRYIRSLPKDGAETPDTEDTDWNSYFSGEDYGEASPSLRDAGSPTTEGRWDSNQLRNSHFYRLVFMLLFTSPDRSTTGCHMWDDSKWRREWESAFGEARDLWEYVHDISRVSLHHQVGSGNAGVVRRLQPRIMHTAYTGHSINYLRTS